MAASSTPELDWIAPWVNWRMVIGVPVPNPTWVSPRPAPSDSVTRSRKLVVLSLNPGVLRLARLLPTTSMAVDMASSAERAVEKDVNIVVSCQLVVWVVPVVVPFVVPVVVPTSASRSLRMADRSVPIFMDALPIWNCANWVRNWVPSAGLNGSWFLICATRSCRNMSLVTSEAPVAAVVLDEGELAPPVAKVESFCEIAEIMGFPLRVHRVAADFGGDHLVYRLLRVTVVVKPGHQPGVDQPAVGHLDHLVRLVLFEGAARGNGIHRHYLAAQHRRHRGGGLWGREVVLVIAVIAVGSGSAGAGAPRIGAEERLRAGRHRRRGSRRGRRDHRGGGPRACRTDHAGNRRRIGRGGGCGSSRGGGHRRGGLVFQFRAEIRPRGRTAGTRRTVRFAPQGRRRIRGARRDS